jgi:hypothetical protein
VPAFV